MRQAKSQRISAISNKAFRNTVAAFEAAVRHPDIGSFSKNIAASKTFSQFMLMMQLCEKVPALKAIAPTQSESLFKITQLTVFTLSISFSVLATIQFRKRGICTV